MAQQYSIDDLQNRLRESGEAAAHVTGKLRAILEDPRLNSATIDDLLLAINTRCVEIADLRRSIDHSDADDKTKSIAGQVEDVWRGMATMVAAKARISGE